MARIALLIILLLSSVAAAADDDGFSVAAIPDSIFSLMQGRSFRPGCPVSRDDLRYLTLRHVDATGREHRGEMVCHKSIADSLIAIFRELYRLCYPIEKIRLIDRYDGDDVRSMADNNTSCFNYRRVAGSKSLSRHAYGMAVDINPLYNPQVRRGVASPPQGQTYAKRWPRRPMMISVGDTAWRAFTRRGFRWGGSWRRSKDYQHFYLSGTRTGDQSRKGAAK